MPSSRDLPDPGIERTSLTSPALAGGLFLPLMPPENPFIFLSQSCINGHLGCKHPLPTTQGTILHTHGRHQMVNTEIRLIIFFAASDGEALYQLAKTRLGADCDSDHELLIAKFRLKLKKVGKTTRPFRYDLNQIPYDYTVEVTNRFKGLDLIDKSA